MKSLTEIFAEANKKFDGPYPIPEDAEAVKIESVVDKPGTIVGFSVYTDKEGTKKVALGMCIDGKNVRVHTSAKRILEPLENLIEVANTTGEKTDLSGSYCIRAYHSEKTGKSSYWIA